MGKSAIGVFVALSGVDAVVAVVVVAALACFAKKGSKVPARPL
jgi:hypothetical protein